MPLIGDFKQKKTKKFVKKEYRPWDETIALTPSKEAPEKVEGKETGEEELPFNLDPLTSSLTSDADIKSKETVSLPLPSRLASEDFAPTPLNEKQEENLSSLALEQKQELNLEKYARGLYGLQRGLLHIIIENISYVENGFAISKPLSGQDLSLALKAPINSIKGSLQRLIKAKVIDTHDFKPGRGGYSCYKVPEVYMGFFKTYFKG